MALREEMEASGDWLFRHRSHLPLVLVVPTVVAMQSIRWPLDNYNLQECWELFCMVVCFAGLSVRAFTVGHTPEGTSGRNTTEQLAATLNTTGVYSVVRHPLYAGNFLIWLGVAMFPMHLWLIVIFAMAFWMHYERIMLAEEEFLRKKFGAKFDEWASVTPAIIPNLSLWRPAALPFSLRNVLRREYSGFFAIISCFFVLEIIEHYVVENRLVFEPMWLAVGAFGLVTYLTLRTLKKQTRLLHVEGR